MLRKVSFELFLSLHTAIETFFNYISFPDVRHFENLLFHGGAFDLEIRVKRLVCQLILKGLVPSH